MIFTPEQEAFLGKLLAINHAYNVTITEEGKTVELFNNSSEMRTLMKETFHTVFKKPGYKTIWGEGKLDDLTVRVYDWAQCKRVGVVKIRKEVPVETVMREVEVTVTNCDMTQGRYKEEDVIYDS